MIGTDGYHILIDLQKETVSENLRKLSLQDYRRHEIDYRLSQIEVISIDLNKRAKMEDGKHIESLEPLKATFLGEGVIKLYREWELEDEELKEGATRPSTTIGDETMVSIIALPTYFTATDLLGFIGDDFTKYISHIRILKSEKANRFLVLIKFTDVVKAAEFQFKFNGKNFNSMEPETCHVIFVKSVQFNDDNAINEDEEEDDHHDSLIPFLLNDPFTSIPRINKRKQIFTRRNSFLKKPIPPPTPILRELPSCPVCLERMDSTVSGLLTIPCQHTFHCQCLSKWKDDSCPVCRYSNNGREGRDLAGFASPNLIRSRRDSQVEPDRCSQCEIDENLWICLVCGVLGCGRYNNQHSLVHFENTGHCFAMDVDSQRVWDYVGDNYVHRLLTNQSDGKLVELPEKSAKGTETPDSAKIDQIGFEYSQLLISQLESQREYYEDKINESADKLADFSHEHSDIVLANKQLSANFASLQAQMDEMKLKTLPEVHKLMKKNEVKNDKLTGLVDSLTKNLREEKSLNEALSAKVEHLTELSGTLTAERDDLQEQVKDLMFYLESQEKFKDASDEYKEGTVVMKPGPQAKKKKSKK